VKNFAYYVEELSSYVGCNLFAVGWIEPYNVSPSRFIIVRLLLLML